MEILLLYNNDNAKKLAGKLQEAGHRVIPWKEEIRLRDLERMHPDRIISYTYHFIIRKEVIESLNYPILNLHISYLPWNRGVSPNFWSFIEDTPKGVTIHEINEKIDAGRILLQKKLFFDEKQETFASTYERLNEEIVSLFMRHSQELLDGRKKGETEAKPTKSTEEKGGREGGQADSNFEAKEGGRGQGNIIRHKGSYHSQKQFESFRKKYPFSWEENIAEFKARINDRKSIMR